MYQQIYYVQKSTGTVADVLLAYGTAILLRTVLQNIPGRKAHSYCPVRIEDRGVYEIHLSEPLQPEWLESVQLPTLAWPIVRSATSDKAKDIKSPDRANGEIPDDLLSIDYDAIWKEIHQENALMKEQKGKRGDLPAEVQELRASFRQQPHREIALLIGEKRFQAVTTYNHAVIQWHNSLKLGYQAANLRAILQAFATPQNNVEQSRQSWNKAVEGAKLKSKITASQVFNPTMGKGQNRAKADTLSVGNETSFWLVEYLKIVGLFNALIPCQIGEQAMYKTYALAPVNIELNDHAAIFAHFKNALGGHTYTPVKADITVLLNYAESYLSYCREAQQSTMQAEGIELNPRNSVRGFCVSTYILLSPNAFTAINTSFLGLPSWLNHVNDIDDVVSLQEVIDEQRMLIRNLEEKHQEDYALLDSYRDFLAGHQLDAFFDFCMKYGEYVVHALRSSQGRFVKPYSVRSLDEIFRRYNMSESETPTNHDLTVFSSTSPQSAGFHRIACAIRESTVKPQRLNARYKSKEAPEKSLYDVRYGLGNQLRRTADSAAEFIAALTEFIQAYNAETEQIFDNTSEERKKDPANYASKHYRCCIAVSDVDEVLSLVKQYGPYLVCNMLLAYGYAAIEPNR